MLEAETDPRLRAVKDEYDRMATDPSRALAYLERAGEFGPTAEPLEIRVVFVQSAVITRAEKEEP